MQHTIQIINCKQTLMTPSLPQKRIQIHAIKFPKHTTPTKKSRTHSSLGNPIKRPKQLTSNNSTLKFIVQLFLPIKGSSERTTRYVGSGTEGEADRATHGVHDLTDYRPGARRRESFARRTKLKISRSCIGTGTWVLWSSLYLQRKHYDFFIYFIVHYLMQ